MNSTPARWSEVAQRRVRHRARLVRRRGKRWHDACSAKNLSGCLARHLAEVLADISQCLLQLWAGPLLQLGGEALHLRNERPVDCHRRRAVTPHYDRGSSRKDLTRRLPCRAVLHQEEEDFSAV